MESQTGCEWKGQRSNKWSTCRSHVKPPGIEGENVKEKIFSGITPQIDFIISICLENYVEPPSKQGKKHFEIKGSATQKEKPPMKLIRHNHQNSDK